MWTRRVRSGAFWRGCVLQLDRVTYSRGGTGCYGRLPSPERVVGVVGFGCVCAASGGVGSGFGDRCVYFLCYLQ